MTQHSIVPRNGVQSPQALFPRAGDVIHPVLRNRGLVSVADPGFTEGGGGSEL